MGIQTLSMMDENWQDVWQVWYAIQDRTGDIIHEVPTFYKNRKDDLPSEFSEEICNCNVYDDWNTGLRWCPEKRCPP